MSESTPTPVETVTATIDGRSVTVPKGTTILQAAEQVGTRVPHYCYHEGLSRPAMCRLCLVDVEGAPKLQPSCVTPLSEGQVVHTDSPKAQEMRTGVLEFYLANHPLDCPVCDQSGECKLQDYVHAEGRVHGRSREPKRVFGRDDFGGDVLFYGDRCVMCTRCVRFMNEVEQDPRLTVVDRGDRSVIDTFFAEGLDGTHFSGNIVDICPVGALVSKDFLFKARAWDLDHTPSVCPSCSQGCNVELHTRDNLVQRIKPRHNAEVNGWWMCDHGRARYEDLNRGGRAEHPLLGVASGFQPAGWDDVARALTGPVREAAGAGVRALVSPECSNEEIGALAALIDALGGGEIVYRSRRADPDFERPLPGFPTLVRRRDLAPNGTGAERLGARRVGDDAGAGGLDDLAAHRGLLIVLGDRLIDQDATFGAAAACYLYLGTEVPEAASAAAAILPIATFAEQEGSFLNVQGRIQRFWPALQAPGSALPAWRALGFIEAAIGGGAVPSRVSQAFGRLGERSTSFSGIGWEEVGTRGVIANEPLQLAEAGR